MDTPREAAKTALRRLHEMGVSRMIMISGDHQKVAEAIANDWRSNAPRKAPAFLQPFDHTR